MIKPKLIFQPNQFTSFSSYYLENFWRQHFDLEWYDSSSTYDRSDSAFVFWWMNAGDLLPRQLMEDGHKVLIDNLWEYPTNRRDFYWIEHRDWFWLNESLWWQALGYDQYRPNKLQQLKKALMPVRRKKPERDYFLSCVASSLDHMIWSYGDKKLPDDADQSLGEYQRYFNPRWYDESFCSVVVETFMTGDNIWITEKTMKALAFFHPILIAATPGTLDHVRSLGFATFDELFDESYDSQLLFEDRCNSIALNLDRINPTAYGSITQQKLEHNHKHFYNSNKIKNIMIEEIINPIYEYVNSR